MARVAKTAAAPAYRAEMAYCLGAIGNGGMMTTTLEAAGSIGYVELG